MGPPPEVRDLLRRARQALRRGFYGDAFAYAKRSLLTKATPAAYAIMTKAQCGQRDLRLAKAFLQYLSGRLRRHVLRWCKNHGLELADR